MKKLIAIIIVLVIIFVGMLIHRNMNMKSNSDISIKEIEKIETYITKIYMWKEITKDALPTFENINNVEELWLWEVIKKNIEEYEISHEQIQEKGRELFGEEFNKEFPKEGSEYLILDEKNNKYYPIGLGLDQKEDSFLLNKIEKLDNGYEVEIIEYMEDYSQALLEEENSEFEIIIQNTNEKEIGRLKNNQSENIKEFVKNNEGEFSKKKIMLKLKDEKVYVESVMKT